MSSRRPPTRSFPLEGPDLDGRLRWSLGEQSVRECLIGLLLTSPGERLMRPNLGAGLSRSVHQPNVPATRELLSAEVRRTIEQHEPRVLLDEVSVVPDEARPAWVAVEVRYRLRDATSVESVRIDLPVGP